MTQPKSRQRLTANETAKLVGDQPNFVGPEALATFLQMSRKTIDLWLDAGRLDDAARKRGKHWLISTNKAIDELFNGTDWKQ